MELLRTQMLMALEKKKACWQKSGKGRQTKVVPGDLLPTFSKRSPADLHAAQLGIYLSIDLSLDTL